MPPRSSGTLSDRDCRTCNRRRIRCDRKLPRCSKCLKKGLICPGYHQTLRWTNAIAVRGRLRGRTAPDDIQNAPSSVRDSDAPPSPSNTRAPDQSIAVLERFTQPVVNRLIRHYELHLTPIMTWIDFPDNKYRRFILPLAASQPILRLSILASAARHAATDSGVDEDLLRCATEAAVKMITLRLTQLNGQDLNTAWQYDIDSTEILAIIAAVLVLSDYSLLRSNVSIAQSHREGIRTLLSTLQCTTTHETEILSFLKDEAAAYDVLACTALFRIDAIRNAVVPSSSNGVFAYFLRIVHSISVRSLQTANDAEDAAINSADRPIEWPISMTEMEHEFEAARGATLLAAGPLLASASDTLKQDFAFLVAAYHHAGLMYADKRLSCISMEESSSRYHTERLFDILKRLQESAVVIGGLTWPLFIAGICASGNTDRMQKVENWCRRLATYTRYEHYNLLHEFLLELHHASRPDWTLLAKQYEDRGEPIVPI